MRLGVRLSCCCCTCAAACTCTPSTPLEHSWCARRGLTLLATLDVRFSGHPRNSSTDNADGYFHWDALHLQVPRQTTPAADRASARCCPMSPYVPENCHKQTAIVDVAANADTPGGTDAEAGIRQEDDRGVGQKSQFRTSRRIPCS